MSQRRTNLRVMKENALTCIQSRQFTEARTLLEEVCRADARDGQAWFLLGAVNGQLEQFGMAAECLYRAVELDSANVEARYNLGQAYMHLGRYREAVATYEATLHVDPAHIGALQNLRIAQARLEQGATNAAIPPHPPTASNTNIEHLFTAGQRLLQKRNWVAARTEFLKLLRLAPDHLPSLLSMGRVCQEMEEHDESVRYLQHALHYQPASTEALIALGNALRELTRLPEAATCYHRALELNEDLAEARHNLGAIFMMQGMAREAEGMFRRVLRQDPKNLYTRSCLLYDLNYSDNDPRLVYREHLEWDHRQGISQTQRRFPMLTVEPGRHLRVGYVSPDLRAHPVAFFMQPLLACHDPDVVEVVCYSDVTKPDKITAYLRTLAKDWRSVHGVPDEKLANRIKRDRIDILVDLAGHTAHHRLGVFARKPAPIQVTYLGYPNTTGLAVMDYRFTDAWADPPGWTEHLHSERLVRLPDGFLCFRPAEGIAVSPPPSLHSGYVTFGSFNNMGKITEEVIALWCDLLHAVPGSHLMLKYKALHDKAIRTRVHGLFAKHGIEAQRVELTGWLDKMRDHLGSYARVDIGLDTFPYNGTTTTCEALWLGVPVVTLAGKVHAGRVGVSLLSQVGLTELIADSPQEYVELAVRLAGDPARLSALRANLRDRMANSSLCNGPRFARHVEAAYRSMWREWCTGKGR